MINLEILEKYTALELIQKIKHPYRDYILWDYTRGCMFEAAWDEVTLTCRGLITDLAGNIVARGFPKFFNLGEQGNKNVPLVDTSKNYTIYQKLDGSLLLVSIQKDGLLVNTRGSFISDQALHGTKLIERYICDGVVLKSGITYCFEIIYPENKIVVDYGNLNDIILIGMLRPDGTEIPLSDAPKGLKVVDTVHCDEKDLTKLSSFVSDTEEGYVLLFEDGNRVKVKGSTYVKVHKLLSNLSNKSIWCMCAGLDSGLDDFVSLIPDPYKKYVLDTVQDFMDKYSGVVSKMKGLYEGIPSEVRTRDRKGFAEYVLANFNKEESNYIFMLHSNKDISSLVWKSLKPKGVKFALVETE